MLKHRRRMANLTQAFAFLVPGINWIAVRRFSFMAGNVFIKTQGFPPPLYVAQCSPPAIIEVNHNEN